MIGGVGWRSCVADRVARVRVLNMVMPRSGASSRAPRLIPQAGRQAGPQVVVRPFRSTLQFLQGDCVPERAKLRADFVALVFAAPPYNLQLQGDLKRPDDSRVDAVNDHWDKFSDFAAYDDFTRAWLTSCRRGMKPNATFWVIGSYHNIFSVGAIFPEFCFSILHAS